MGDEDWLSTWLQNLNLSEYWSNFVNNGYNSSELCCTILDKHELNRIGVGKVGHVNRLFRALEKLRADTGTRGRGENGLTGLEVSLEHPRQPDTGTLPTAHVVVEGESGRGGRKPPPVPTRKSTRRKTPSPTPSPTPPQCSSPEDGSGGRVTPEGGSSLPPPPVIPRQHSLRHQRGKPAARLRTSTGTSSMARPSHQELSPIPQSPVITNKQPGFPVPVSAGIQSPKHEVDQSAEHQNQCLAADAVSEISAERQRPSPVPRHKSSSPLERRGSGKPPPLPPPRVSSNPGVLATEETATLRPNGSIQDEVESVGVPASPVKVVSPEIARNPEERPPALPPKKYSPRSPQKQVIIPDGEVVFDLEDIPMPPTPANLNAPAGLDLPPLPPKDGRVPSFTPPPPPQGPLQDGLPSLPPKHTFGPPPFPPPTLPGRSPEPTLSRVNGRGGPPPAPPPRKSTLKPETTAPIEVSPVLPPKDGGAPPFSPPPPVPQASGEDWSASFVSSPPPVPPKSSASPPPPPPITPEDYPYEECSDSEGEGDAPLISISSKPGPEAAEDDTFLFLSASAREGSPSEDSDASPMHIPSRSAVIRQATADGDEIIMVGGSASERDGMRLEGGTNYLNNPGVDDTRDYENDDAVARAVNDLKDYENEDAIARAINDTKDYENDDAIARAINDLKDYENQDAIDRAIKEEEGGDFVNLSPVDGATRIRGLMPIRSKRAGEEGGPDYENQDVLDADIIPVASFPLAVGAGQVGAAPRLPRVQYENSEFQVPLPHVPPKPTTTEDRQLPQAVSPDRLTPNASGAHKPAQDFGCLSLDRGTRPPHSQQSGMLAPPNAPQSKPRSKTTLNAPTLDLAPGNAVYDTLEGVVASNGGVRPFPHSAPKAMGDYFDGGGVLPRSTGTFAGLTGDRVVPTYRKSPSVDAILGGSTALQLVGSISPLYSRLGSATLSDVPKTKEGYLHKKGGKKSERPWQKRWVTFNGSELKYFKTKIDKESEALNKVRLSEMIDIKKVTDQEKPRFDLVVINRVFQFYAETTDECGAWVNVLHAAISRFKPQDEEFKEGGSLCDPDKQGVILKQGHGFHKSFRERYVALKGSKFAYYENRDDFNHGRPIHILDMSLASVRPDSSGKHRFIIQMTTQKSYVFQASSASDRKEWLEMLTNAILMGLDTRPQTMSRSAGTPKRSTSSDILCRIQENPANKSCADCSSMEPVWGVINKGIMVCINCSGVHRSMGTHISKVRSIELDHQIWTDTLIQLMVEVGNNNSNSFWERYYQGGRLSADVEREIREQFIRAKYQMMSWISRPTGESGDMLGQLLCVSVGTDNLMRTLELLAHGASPCYLRPDVSEGEPDTVLDIAKAHGQDLQVELLIHNGALVCPIPQDRSTPYVSKKGHLYKTGSDRTGWKRRYCALDMYQGFKYYRTEVDVELLGDIRVEEMLSVCRCEDETGKEKDPKYRFAFEVNTQGRGYLFCAESEAELDDWITTFNKIIPSNAAENLGFDKVGYLMKRDPHNLGGWKRRWFTLKDKSLKYYRKEREEVSEIDLRKVTELQSPDMTGPFELQCSFQIILTERIYHLRAESPAEAEAWISALKHTQVSGIPLGEQQLTSNGLPILVHKCLQFVESYGLDVEGLYRLSGVKANIRRLILAFNQDARGVQIVPEVYTVHDVTGCMKQFFRSLPDPLLTHQLYAAFISAVQTSGHEQLLYQMQSLIERLPEVNRETLKRVMCHLKKVIDHERQNKMGRSNLVSLFAPTLMTVDDDPVSYLNAQYEFAVLSTMIENYKWLFQVDADEEMKEVAIEDALKKIKNAERQQKTGSIMSSSTDFLTTVHIGSREGDSYGIKITGITTVGEVVEKVATQKALPPSNYALYLILGDSESQRVLSFSEKLLAVLYSTGSDNFLCLKPNIFAETLEPFMSTEMECVCLHIKEKKKWKKYYCAIRGGYFVQYKDVKLHTETCRIAMNDFDVFAGIERTKIDVRNPMPTKYCFWFKGMKGDEFSKYLCAESEQDMLRAIAGVVRVKYPDGLLTPILPTRPPELDRCGSRGSLHASPGASPRTSPMATKKTFEENTYSNVKLSGRPR